MAGVIRLYDYRCFRRENPAELVLHEGFASFIGPNNSGKSALIRSLYELRACIEQLGGALPGNITHLVTERRGFNLAPPMSDKAEIVANRPDPHCVVEFVVDATPEELGQLHANRLRLEFASDGESFQVRVLVSDGTEFTASGTPHSALSLESSGHVRRSDGTLVATRTLSNFIEAVRNARFFGPFRNAINEGAGSHYDVQVGTGFIAQWHQWKTGASKKQNTAIQRVTEDVRRLMGAKTLEINASIELKTLQVVVDGKPFKLLELGAGISQLIVVLGNALIQAPSFIAIDEPETHLHPALQSEFITTLGGYARDGMLFATHSMGLARATADRCFSVQQTSAGSIVRPFERTPHYSEFLGSLGIAGLQELGWDRVLFVEGPTDVRTFQQLLRLYEKNKHTILLPLGGDTMINGKVEQELTEVLRLGNKVSIVIDSERSQASAALGKSRQAFVEICNKLGIRCCVTVRRATENYLTEQAIAASVGPAFKALGDFGKPGDAGQFWGKSENWRVAQAMTREEIDSTDLGEFLRSI